MSVTGNRESITSRTAAIGVLKDFVGGATVRVVGVLISFLCNVWIARISGAEAFGSYSVFVQWVAIAGVILSCGIPDIALREASKRPMPDSGKEDIFLGLRLLSLLALLGVLVFLWSCAFFYEVKYYSLIAVCAALMALATFFQGLVRAQIGSGIALLPLAIGFPAFILCSVFLLRFTGGEVDFYYLGFIYFCGLLFSVFLFILGSLSSGKIKEFWKGIESSFSLLGLKGLVVRGGPFLGLAVVSILSARLDMMVVLLIDDAVQAGYYAAAARVSEAFLLPVVMLNFSLLPVVVRCFRSGDDSGMVYIVVRAYRVLALPFIVLVLIFIFFSKELIIFLYGEEYSEALSILRMLLVAQVANLVWGGSGMMLLASNREKMSFYIGLISSVFGGVLLVLLGSFFGIVRLALASSVSFVCWRLALSIAVERTVGFSVSVVSPRNALREKPL